MSKPEVELGGKNEIDADDKIAVVAFPHDESQCAIQE